MQKTRFPTSTAKIEEMSDEEVVVQVLTGKTALFEIIMRRYNQRLYRATRAILRGDAQAEEVVRDAYLLVYQYLAQLAGRARFGAWLLRVAVNEGLMRLRSRRHYEEQSTTSEDEGEASRARLPNLGRAGNLKYLLHLPKNRTDPGYRIV